MAQMNADGSRPGPAPINGTLKSLAALLVYEVHSQSDGRKSALASFIARSSTRTSPRFGLRSGMKADMFLT